MSVVEKTKSPSADVLLRMQHEASTSNSEASQLLQAISWQLLAGTVQSYVLIVRRVYSAFKDGPRPVLPPIEATRFYRRYATA